MGSTSNIPNSFAGIANFVPGKIGATNGSKRSSDAFDERARTILAKAFPSKKCDAFLAFITSAEIGSRVGPDRSILDYMKPPQFWLCIPDVPPNYLSVRLRTVRVVSGTLGKK